MSQIHVNDSLWTRIQGQLKTQLAPDLFTNMFADLRGREEAEGTLIVTTDSDFGTFWLEDNYLPLLKETAIKMAGRPIEVIIQSEPQPENRVVDAAAPGVGQTGLNGRARPSSRAPNDPARRHPGLNPRYSFDNYIVGSCNQLAHSASMAVAKEPGLSYNPLFLYGETGLGKTHLMHAMANAIFDNAPELRVVYVSCEKFTNEFMTAIQGNSLASFRRTYRNMDVLIIDDVQFLEGKERTQEEFFHTFNELFESGHQICLSSDRPANEITKLESRLVSRFQWGMVADLQAPDLETRLAILKKKTSALHASVPDALLQFLAERVTRNVRLLEGALTKVAAACSVRGHPLSIDQASQLIQDILQQEASQLITMEKIQKKVAEYFDLRLADLLGRRRPANIAFPRQVAMYLSRVLTNHPLTEIGNAFGGRDHGTVIHACKTVEAAMEQDENTRRSVEILTKQLTVRTF